MTQVKGDIYFDDLYDDLSIKEFSKIKKFISKNIDVFEIAFTPMHEIMEQRYFFTIDHLYSFYNPSF